MAPPARGDGGSRGWGVRWPRPTARDRHDLRIEWGGVGRRGNATCGKSLLRFQPELCGAAPLPSGTSRHETLSTQTAARRDRASSSSATTSHHCGTPLLGTCPKPTIRRIQVSTPAPDRSLHRRLLLRGAASRRGTRRSSASRPQSRRRLPTRMARTTRLPSDPLHEPPSRGGNAIGTVTSARSPAPGIRATRHVRVHRAGPTLHAAAPSPPAPLSLIASFA